MLPLLAADDVTVAGIGGIFVVVIGALGAWVLKVKEAHNALLIKLEELRQGGKVKDDEAQRLQDEQDQRTRATEFTQFQSQITAATRRIEQLEERSFQDQAMIRSLVQAHASCEAREAALLERISWLELNPGKSPPKREQSGDSGTHRPLNIEEGD